MQSAAHRRGHHGDAVVIWNAHAGVAATKACIAPLADPFHESRMYAMMHVAIHDALNAIDHRFRPYTFDKPVAPGASPEVAVAAAARDVLVPLLGQLPRELASQACSDAGVASVEAAYSAALAALPEAPAKAQGICRGPGLWVGKDPVEPLMGTWKPWLMTRGDQFRPGPPPAVGSAEFQEELALLKRINSSSTPSQRAIATSFAVKGLDFIWEPGYALVRRERLSVPREVRLLAPLAVVQWDAYIAAHDTKYTFWGLRPSMADPTIMPFIPLPNHPAYVSTAAIIASAAAVLVSSMFPQEAAYWQYLGEEAGLSRIYGGIHYPSDEHAGNRMGKSIGALAVQRDQLNGQ